MSIRQLPEHVVDKIKSSIAVTSLTGAVCGLVKNSLDAQATKVNIRVDFARGNCTVEDNGLGVLPDEFRVDGGLLKLHHTSRFPPSPDVHGRHGTFLASLGTLSFLSMTSHHHKHIPHNTISIHNGHVLERQLPSRPEQRYETFDHGTQVAVRDLFGLMPVRVKYRATRFSSSSSIDKEFGRLVLEAVALLLAWPSVVSVLLVETTTKREIRLKPPIHSDLVARTCRLLMQASLADSSDVESWVPVSASSSYATIKGCISSQPMPTRRSQFISLGIQPLANDYGVNIFYEEVNKMFNRSSFGVVDQDENERQTNGRLGNDLKQKLKRSVERWPMFYLQIILDPDTSASSVDDVLNSSGTNVAAVLDLLKIICYAFLKKQHLRPHKFHASSKEPSLSTSRTLGRSRQPRQGLKQSSASNITGNPSSQHSVFASDPANSKSPFDAWHRIKVGLPTSLGRSPKNISSQAQSTTRSANNAPRLVGENGRLLLSKPFNDIEITSIREQAPEKTAARESNMSSRDISHRADAPNKSTTLSTTEPNIASSSDKEPGPRNQIFRALERRPKPPPSPWLQEILDSWENPVFENTQPLIHHIYNESTTSQRGNTGLHRCGGEPDIDVRLETSSVGLNGRISRESLSKAEVIAQVDRKFILVKLPLGRSGRKGDATSSSSALVMLDQHAADERCQLEQLMSKYFERGTANGEFNAVVKALEPPLLFEIGTTEGGLLTRYQSHFEAWGIRVQVSPHTESTSDSKHASTSRVIVSGLPTSISERCRSEPRLVVELLRKQVWAFEDGSAAHAPPVPNAEPSLPGDASSKPSFHGCPRGILELMHSRSCRSAIMFNDALSLEECKDLVRRLSQCAFPFQCAHGRPSMVPLVDLGSSSSSSAPFSSSFSSAHVRSWHEGDERCGTLDLWKKWTAERE